MYEFLPGYSCVVTEPEITQDPSIYDKYQEVFILGSNGTIFKRKNLSHGRHITIKDAKLPKTNGKSELGNDISFLPAGKVPYEFYLKAYRFFLDVMKDLKAPQEAMIHILWNETQGYHIGVPTQKVSKASVRYDFDDVKPEDIIVVDIHSHNTMGAFFSSTDDGDDRKGIWYSGVFGKLDKPTPETVWRFNTLDWNCKVSVSDIFQVEEDLPEKSPKEWLDKVTVGTGYKGKGTGSGKVQTPSQGVNRPVLSYDPQKRAWVDKKALGQNGGKKSPVNIDDFEEYADFVDTEAFDTLSAAEMFARGFLDPEDNNILDLSEYEEDLAMLQEARGDAEHDMGKDDEEAEDAMEQITIWFESLEDYPERQLEVLRAIYEQSADDVQANISQNGF